MILFNVKTETYQSVEKREKDEIHGRKSIGASKYTYNNTWRNREKGEKKREGYRYSCIKI